MYYNTKASGARIRELRIAKNFTQDITAPELDTGTLTQRLDAVELGIVDFHMLRIPEGRPAELGHLGVFNSQSAVVPEWIAKVEEAVVHRDVPALLKGALTVGGAVKGTVLGKNTPHCVKGSFLIEGFVLNRCHCYVPLSG